MAPQEWTTNTPNPTPDPVGYQVDDLTIELAPRRVRRAGTAIPLKALSFDLLIALVRAAPNLLSFDQLSERVWSGLVISPETIVQRVKLLRGALGDDPQAPRYIEGVRGRGYRMVAAVRPLKERQDFSESIVPPSLQETSEEKRARSGQAGMAISAAAAVSSLAGTLTLTASLCEMGSARLDRRNTDHRRRCSRPLGRSSVTGAQPIRLSRRASWSLRSLDSLAVLPLDNLSGDKEQAYFADGMTDALTTDLAQIGSLRVISRTSAMHFKGSKETLPQIGRELQVDAVVEGTVTRSENRVRVTAQLVEVSSDRHLWARTYERDLKDILALQDAIAQDVAEQIRVKLTPKERNLLIQTHAVDPEAYDAYLKGRYWFNQITPEGLEKALRLLPESHG